MNTTLIKNKHSWRVGGSIWGKCNNLKCEKCIFTAKLKDNIPTLQQVKANVMIMYKYEEFKFQMKDKENIFEKRWGILKNHLENR